MEQNHAEIDQDRVKIKENVAKIEDIEFECQLVRLAMMIMLERAQDAAAKARQQAEDIWDSAVLAEQAAQTASAHYERILHLWKREQESKERARSRSRSNKK